MKIKRKSGLLALALTLGSTVATATPVTIFDNLTGETFGNASGGQVFGITPPGTTIASTFSTNTSCPGGCTLGDVSLWMVSNAGTPASSFAVSLFADDNTETRKPGTLLTTFSNPATITSSLNANVFTPGSAVTLLDNTEYWIGVSLVGSGSGSWGRDDTTIARWFNSALELAPPPFGGLDNPNVTGTALPGIFKVEGDALPVSNVPLPGAAWLMATGIMGLVIRSRKT